ncbi:sigma-54 interaction domain-containing protein [Arhodomonas sp. AD133]|uniref:sigma-54 interaction domain-containing protein n=1 Tax=Arhodomonas sp. AD133 TaxID=3415009 RepID=UPI003EBA43C3
MAAQHAPEADRLLAMAIDAMEECVVVVDVNGSIRYLNTAYSQFLGIDRADALGRHVTEVIENTRMHVVARGGAAETAQMQWIRGRHMIASRYPLFDGDRAAGAVGMVVYRDTAEWRETNARIRALMAELDYYREAFDARGAPTRAWAMIGDSPALEALRQRIRKVAAGDGTVLIRGESGSGKELCARALHQGSERADGPFVAVNCGAVPEDLLEAELFGYETGAFTGARRGGKPGRVQLADGGTLFLDEIGDMPPAMQVKLLRVLQNREVEPIGGTRSIPVDVRVVAATHRPLERLVERGQFREDLFYRINVVPLTVPPLRERREDIPALVDHCLERLATRMTRPRPRVTEAAMRCLSRAHWPGNIRELENSVEAAFYLCEADTITPADLPATLTDAAPAAEGTLQQILDATERRALEQALAATAGNRTAAARRLGIGKSTFYEKLARHGIRPEIRTAS